MATTTPFLTLNQPCPEAVATVTQMLTTAGFRVLQTFDFQTARAAHTGCTCPQHGTQDCDCQMVVLLVYSPADLQPASLVAHGHDGQTWLSLVDTPEQRPAEPFGLDIRRALSPPGWLTG